VQRLLELMAVGAAVPIDGNQAQKDEEENTQLWDEQLEQPVEDIDSPSGRFATTHGFANSG